jgi:hypothetical protein
MIEALHDNVDHEHEHEARCLTSPHGRCRPELERDPVSDRNDQAGLPDGEPVRCFEGRSPDNFSRGNRVAGHGPRYATL